MMSGNREFLPLKREQVKRPGKASDFSKSGERRLFLAGERTTGTKHPKALPLRNVL